jgi:tetratricopeptide (TPR) repeat protein
MPVIRRSLSFVLAVAFLLFLAGVVEKACASIANQPAVDTAALNRDPQVQAAFQRFYDLDYDGALQGFDQVQASHRGDPLATDYILDAVVFKELNRLDLLDTTFYANDGFLTGKHTVVEDPQVRDRVKGLAAEAINEANARLNANPNDLDALFARGWARSLEATYEAMVERAFGAALKLALGARGDHEKVLHADPNYVDAKMVVGIYEYVVGALPWGFKLLVGFAGIHGSKTDGMALLQDAAARGVITSVDSRTAMMLFLRREAKYGQAITVAHGLADQYPRDFLFNLEIANLEKDNGEGMTAVWAYQHVINLAERSGYFANAHVELAYFGMGDSLRGQKHYPEAVGAYRHAAYSPTTSPELKRRCLLAAGESYDLAGQHAQAVQQYREVLQAGADTVQGNVARRYIKVAYTGGS